MGHENVYYGTRSFITQYAFEEDVTMKCHYALKVAILGIPMITSDWTRWPRKHLPVQFF